MKYISIPYLRDLDDIMEFIAKIYETNSKPKSKYYNFCAISARYSRLILIIIPWLYSSLATIYFIPSNIKSIWSGTYTPSMNLHLPGLNENQPFNLVLTELYNLLVAVFCLFVIISMECLISFTLLWSI